MPADNTGIVLCIDYTPTRDNDLGRVCRFDSVNVDRYAYVERYSHVMHIVSSVSGERRTRRR